MKNAAALFWEGQPHAALKRISGLKAKHDRPPRQHGSLEFRTKLIDVFPAHRTHPGCFRAVVQVTPRTGGVFRYEIILPWRDIRLFRRFAQAIWQEFGVELEHPAADQDPGVRAIGRELWERAAKIVRAQSREWLAKQTEGGVA